jgi:hypothetical protein
MIFGPLIWFTAILFAYFLGRYFRLKTLNRRMKLAELYFDPKDLSYALHEIIKALRVFEWVK